MRVMAQTRPVSRGPSRQGCHTFHTGSTPLTAVDTGSALKPPLGAQAARREQGGDPFCSRSLASSGGDIAQWAPAWELATMGFRCDLGARSGGSPMAPLGEQWLEVGSRPAQEDPGPWCRRVDASTQKHVGGRGLCHSCPLSIWDATGPPQGAWCVETFGVLSEPGNGQSFVPSRKAFTRDSSSSACGQAAI